MKNGVSKVYTDRPDYADFDSPAKFEAIKSIIAKRLIEHPDAICSYSGGSDSDIMLDLIERTRAMFELPPIKYVFFNTGLEMKATRDHVKYVAEKYGVEIEERRPEINIVQIEKGKSFIFTADVATKPEVKLGEYKGLEVDKVSTRVTQKEVDAKIQEEAEKNAREVVVTDRPVADGDEVILDFEGFVDGEAFEGGKGENYPLTIGSGSFIPGFEEQLVGAEAEKEVEVKVTFPEDYHAEELKGKEAVFKCTVHEIKAKELPEIDDEFAAEVSEFDTLEEYKADVKAKIKEQKAADGKRNQEDQAVEQAVKNAEYEIPQPMIDTQTTQMVEDFAQRIQSQGITLEQYFQFTGLTAEKMMEDMKPQAIKRIETRLVLEAIAKAENIEITDEKVDEELAKMAESYKMEVEKLKEFMGENEKKQMKEDLAVQEAVTFLVENAVEK